MPIGTKHQVNKLLAFSLWLLCFMGFGILTGTLWYYLALKFSLLLQTPAPIILGTTAISTAFYLLNYISQPQYYQTRISELKHTLNDQLDTHRKTIQKRMAASGVLVFIVFILSLILKEVFQDMAGHLISMAYLLQPIAFCALIIVTLSILYLACTPMFTEDEVGTPKAEQLWWLAHTGEFLYTLISNTIIFMGFGYCFACFYDTLIPAFSIAGMSTTMSIIAISAALGLFTTTLYLLCVREQTETHKSVGDFSIFFQQLFSRENNSMRRIYKSIGIVWQNSIWALCFSTATFTILYGIPLIFGIPSACITSLSSSVFLHTLGRVIPISIGTHLVISSVEAACTKHNDRIIHISYKKNNTAAPTPLP